MRLTVNGETRTFEDDVRDVAGLVAALGLDTRKVAVERNLVYGAGGFAFAPAVVLGGTASRPQVAVPDTSTSPTVVLEGITTTTVPTTEAPVVPEAPEGSADTTVPADAATPPEETVGG